ncbi:MAG TPA: response regulator [Candidatus Bathyarchaeia archaeon]|nr:response regulator [Candidatus Bathyarchaeia archaeon]
MTRNVPNILVVDDDINICQALSLILIKRGWNVEVANTGKEALQKAQVRAFNVALLDIRLPDIEGTKLLKLLPKTTPKMIKIMVTGYPELRNAVEALNDGADAYLMKPVRPEDLLITIRAKLEEQQQSERATEETMTGFLETRAKKLLENVRAE